MPDDHCTLWVITAPGKLTRAEVFIPYIYIPQGCAATICMSGTRFKGEERRIESCRGSMNFDFTCGYQNPYHRKPRGKRLHGRGRRGRIDFTLRPDGHAAPGLHVQMALPKEYL